MPDIFNEIEKRGISLPAWIIEKFDSKKVGDYYSFLMEYNDRGSFFSKKDSERILERHLAESLVITAYVSKHLSVSRETEILDAGSGPGLPGYLFFCMTETPKLTLLDASRRRLGLLQNWVESAGRNSQDIARIKFSYDRAEEHIKKYDIVLIRAFIPFPFFLEVLCRLPKLHGFLVYCSTTPLLPISISKNYPENLGFVSRETPLLNEIAFLGERTLSFLQKERETPPAYPRKWSIIKGEMELWEK